MIGRHQQAAVEVCRSHEPKPGGLRREVYTCQRVASARRFRTTQRSKQEQSVIMEYGVVGRTRGHAGRRLLATPRPWGGAHALRM